MKTNAHRARLIALSMMTGLVLAGCHAPRGETSGRIGVSETTEPETKSGAVLPVVLLEFSDQAPQHLIEKLNNLPQVRDTEGRVTVILGDLNNQTQRVPTSDFEVAARRFRDNLINSPVGQGKLQFVEYRSRMERLAARERVGEKPSKAGPANYDEDRTYTLNGNFIRINRGGTNYYYLNFELVHFATNEIVFSDRYEVKQVTKD